MWTSVKALELGVASIHGHRYVCICTVMGYGELLAWVGLSWPQSHSWNPCLTISLPPWVQSAEGPSGKADCHIPGSAMPFPS